MVYPTEEKPSAQRLDFTSIILGALISGLVSAVITYHFRPRTVNVIQEFPNGVFPKEPPQ